MPLAVHCLHVEEPIVSQQSTILLYLRGFDMEAGLSCHVDCGVGHNPPMWVAGVSLQQLKAAILEWPLSG